MKKIIKTNKAPLPIGPYNQAVVVGNMVYTSGQIPLDIQTGNIVGTNVSDQTRCVFGYIQALLEDAGASLEKIVKTTVFLKDMSTFVEMNTVYAEFIKSETAPARSTVEVARLPKDVLVEIEVVATVE